MPFKDKEKAREASRRSAKKNYPHRKEYYKKYFQEHKEECKLYQREWRKKNINKSHNYSHKWREKNKSKEILRNQEFRKMNKEFKLNYKKDKCCEFCNYNTHTEILEFHHVRGEKKFDIADRNRSSIKQFEEEIAKCILLCPNCHRLVHFSKGGGKNVTVR